MISGFLEAGTALVLLLLLLGCKSAIVLPFFSMDAGVWRDKSHAKCGDRDMSLSQHFRLSCLFSTITPVEEFMLASISSTSKESRKVSLYMGTFRYQGRFRTKPKRCLAERSSRKLRKMEMKDTHVRAHSKEQAIKKANIISKRWTPVQLRQTVVSSAKKTDYKKKNHERIDERSD